MNLLLAAILLLQDKTAEETFKKIEEQILGAKSLRVHLGALDKGVAGNHVSSSIHMKSGNKFRLEFETKTGDEIQRILQISDGTQIHEASGQRSRTLRPTPSDFNRNQAVALTRLGYWPTWGLVFSSANPTKGLPLEKCLVTSDFKTEKSEGNLGILTYRVSLVLENEKLEESKHTYFVRLYYDPKTYTPAKRMIQDPTGTQGETYRDWSFGSELSEERFRIPEEKK
jgi:outer membrane lipoprotein-sorting protein